MASNHASRPPPTSPVIPSPTDFRPRRDSLNSVSTSSQAEHHLAQALDRIHTSASQSDTLTTFNDFAPPPSSLPTAESKGLAGDLVQNGLSGLYTRLKEAVGVGSAAGTAARTHDIEEADSHDAVSRRSSNTANTTPKGSIASLPRGDTSTTNATFGSKPSSDGVASPGGPNATADVRSDVASSKAPTIASVAVSKSSSSSRPSLTNPGKPVNSDPVIPASLLQRDSGRSLLRTEDSSARGSSKRSISHSDGLSLANTTDGSRSYDAVASGGTSRGRRDDNASLDGSIDSPLSPVKGSGQSIASSSDLRTTSTASISTLAPGGVLRKPAVIDRISGSRSPRGYAGSQASSLEHGTAEASPISTSAHNSVYHDSFSHDTQPQQVRSGALRIPGTTSNEGAPEQVNARLEMMRKQVLSKEFWMADETCKECFLCGNQFSAFRRKHHCRTCGCIFDSKCTSIISGEKFGVQGSLRVCKACLHVINRRHDGSGSEESADDSYLPAIFRPNQSKAPVAVTRAKAQAEDLDYPGNDDDFDDARSIQTPMMAIPATRRVGDANRNSAILEIDAPQLSRPSSSRSLKSLATGRPQSAGHRRHGSKHNFLSRFIANPDEGAPFRKGVTDEMTRKPKYPAFHDDNIIDPDLVDYMSDESSGDEHMSIFTTMSGNDLQAASFHEDKPGFGPFLTAGRRHRHRQGEKSVSGVSFTSRGLEDGSGPSHGRPPRRRNLSNVSSVHHLRSPRPKSGVFKGPSASNESVAMLENPAIETTKLTRSDSMHDEKEPQIELNPSSMHHVRRLLHQLLQDANIPNVAAWERALIPILIQCTGDVTPDVRAGDDMDIRHYVKLKKIPGSKAGDTSYVSGVIFTKNLALKSMPRKIVNPRIVIVSFPIEYQRHQQYMSLGPMYEQERAFLRMVVNRIINLRPQVLLAEKTVSGVALEYLSEANIAVAYNVKTEVIEAVSRCAETVVISSLDMLALPDIPVGRAGGFEVKTYVNNDYPGRKKTYIFLSGCAERLGCTIALRGADTATLSRMKRITEFMVYVVYNLRLETCLMRDEFIRLPPESDDISVLPASRQYTDESWRSMGTGNAVGGLDGPTVVINTANSESEPPSQTSVTTISTTDGSISSEHTETPLPQQRPGSKLISLHESHTSHASHDSAVPEDVPMPTFYSDMVAKYQTKILSASPFVKFKQPHLLVKAREQERRLVYLRRLRDQDVVEDHGDPEKSKAQRFELIKPEMVHAIGQKGPRQIMEILHAVHDAEYDKALYNYQTQTRQWENYIQGSLDLFDPYSHQNIVVLYSVICTETKIPCSEPGLVAISFYDEHARNPSMDPDCTLGQYVEDVCLSRDTICTANGCDRSMLEHHRTYVHDESRVTIFVEQAPKNKVSGDDDITMWSYCKICKKDSPTFPMSDSTWKYSFGKYLELLFWSRGLQLHQTWNCDHDHHLDHIRYFAYRDTCIRMHHDPIDLLEIIVPRARITWKVDNDLRLKNETFTKIEDRWNRFMNSVRARLKGIRMDSVLPEKAEACKAEVERLLKKAQDDQVALMRKLQNTYVNSKYYEIIPFNGVIRDMLEKVGDWDTAFSTFEADFMPDKDFRQLTMMQLKKIFSDNESKDSLPGTDGTSSTVDSTEPPSQTFTDTDEVVPTQPTDYTNSSLAATHPSLDESPTSIKGRDSIHGTDDEKPHSPSTEAALERTAALDLATPTPGDAVRPPINFPEPPGESSVASSTELASPPKSPTKGTPQMSTETSGASGPSLSEKVEQLRREHHSLMSEGGASDPHEPPKVIPERGSSRRAGPNVSPPMIRAISHPVRTLPRSQSKASTRDGRATPVGDGESSVEGSVKADKKLSERFGLKLGSRKPAPSSIPRFVHKKKESKVSTLARHFEQLTREFEKERIRDHKQRAAKMHQSRAFLPRSSTKAIVEVYDDVDEAVQEPGPGEEDERVATDKAAEKRAETATGPSELPSAVPLAGPQTPTESHSQYDEKHHTDVETDDTATANASHAGTDDEGGRSDTEHNLLEDILPDVAEIAASLESSELPLELPRHQKKSVMNILTAFWAERSSNNWPTLEYPVNATDHIFIDSDVIVREDEPSSLIAFALSSEDYAAKLADIRRQAQIAVQRAADADAMGATSSTTNGAEDVDFDGETLEIEPKSYGTVNTEPTSTDFLMDETELEKSLLRITGTHLKYKFVEGSATMLCKIFYAEQFDALRRKCGVADRIIESLSRCLKWDSKGGKTKSVFLKTLDDRLVLKSLSPVETSAFLDFAPAYFGIMSEALFHDLPSVIAKMLGFFQIIIKNPTTGTEIKLDLLVMENLFYDRSPKRIFDLKGSMRNRKIQSTGEQNEVLLDENMVEYIYESPLFAREHSKKLLRASVWNDTLFLARQDVMDYSLMIAVDEAKKELVVGVIDCIRTYTWDKKLESWIKDRGFAGGGRNRPTVTSPKEYKSRFREAMARYILQAPNCWHHFQEPQQPGSGHRARFAIDQHAHGHASAHRE